MAQHVKPMPTSDASRALCYLCELCPRVTDQDLPVLVQSQMLSGGCDSGEPMMCHVRGGWCCMGGLDMLPWQPQGLRLHQSP